MLRQEINSIAAGANYDTTWLLAPRLLAGHPGTPSFTAPPRPKAMPPYPGRCPWIFLPGHRWKMANAGTEGP